MAKDNKNYNGRQNGNQKDIMDRVNQAFDQMTQDVKNMVNQKQSSKQ